MITVKAYRQMRTEILDSSCAKLEQMAPGILERCSDQTLLDRARRMYDVGGSPLPQTVVGRSELIVRIIHAAQIFLVHVVEQGPLWLGDFDTEKARIQAAADQELRAGSRGSRHVLRAPREIRCAFCG